MILYLNVMYIFPDVENWKNRKIDKIDTPPFIVLGDQMKNDDPKSGNLPVRVVTPEGE